MPESSKRNSKSQIGQGPLTPQSLITNRIINNPNTPDDYMSPLPGPSRPRHENVKYAKIIKSPNTPVDYMSPIYGYTNRIVKTPNTPDDYMSPLPGPSRPTIKNLNSPKLLKKQAQRNEDAQNAIVYYNNTAYEKAIQQICNNWREYIDSVEKHNRLSITEAHNAVQEDPTDYNQEWYAFNKKIFKQFLRNQTEIEQLVTQAAYNGDPEVLELIVFEAIDNIEHNLRITKSSFNLTNNEQTKNYDLSARHIQSAPSIYNSTSSTSETLDTSAELQFWNAATNDFEIALYADIEQAKINEDNNLVRSLNQKLYKYQKIKKEQDQNILNALQTNDIEFVENTIFSAIEILYQDDPKGTISKLRRPMSKSVVHSGPSEHLLKMQERHKNIGKIPMPIPNTIEMTQYDKMAMIARNNERQKLMHEKKMKLKEQRELLRVPKHLTDQDRKIVQEKGDKFKKDYETDVKLAKAIGTVKKLIKDMDMKESKSVFEPMGVVPKATRKIRQTLDELLVAAQHGKKMKSEPVAKMVMQNIQEIENEVKQIKEVASKIQIAMTRRPETIKTPHTQRIPNLKSKLSVVSLKSGPSNALIKQRERRAKTDNEQSIIPQQAVQYKTQKMAFWKRILNEVQNSNKNKIKEFRHDKNMKGLSICHDKIQKLEKFAKLQDTRISKAIELNDMELAELLTTEGIERLQDTDEFICRHEENVASPRLQNEIQLLPAISKTGIKSIKKPSTKSLNEAAQKQYEKSIATAKKASQRRLDNLQAIPQKRPSRKSIKSSTLLEATSNILLSPDIPQYTVQYKKQELAFWKQIFNEAQNANKNMIKEFRRNKNMTDLSNCHEKMKKLEKFAKLQEQRITKAIKLNDMELAELLIFEGIERLQGTDEFICRDEENNAAPRLQIEIQSLPTILKTGIKSTKKPSKKSLNDAAQKQYEKSIATAKKASQRRLDNLQAIPQKRPSTKSVKSGTLVEPTSNLLSSPDIPQYTVQYKKQEMAFWKQIFNEAQNANKNMIKEFRRNKNMPDLSICHEKIQKLDKFAKLQEKRILKAIELNDMELAELLIFEGIERLQDTEFLCRDEENNAAPRLQIEIQSLPTISKTVIKSTKKPSKKSLNEATQKQYEQSLLKAKEAAKRRKTQEMVPITPKPVRSIRDMTMDERKAVAERKRLLENKISEIKRIGSERKKRAESAAVRRDHFGAAGKGVKLPKLELPKLGISRKELEKTNRKFQKDYNDFLQSKKSIGAMKKRLYDMTDFIEDRQRKGIVLPAKDEDLQPVQIYEQPEFVEKTNAARQLALERHATKQVKESEKLLNEAYKAKSAKASEIVLKKVASLGPAVKAKTHKLSVARIRPIAPMTSKTSVARAQKIKTPNEEYMQVNELWKFWKNTKSDLIAASKEAARNARREYIKDPLNKIFYMATKKIHDLFMKTVAAEEAKICTAMKTSNWHKVDDAIFEGIEKLVDDKFSVVNQKNAVEKPKTQKQQPDNLASIVKSQQIDANDLEDATEISKIMDLEEKGIDSLKIGSSLRNPMLRVDAVDENTVGSVVPSHIPTTSVLANEMNVRDLDEAKKIIQTCINNKMPENDLATRLLNENNLNTNISTKTKSNKMNESLQYSLKLEAPKVENLFQLRSSTMPNWFPGYFTAHPGINGGKVTEQCSPSKTLLTAWLTMKPEAI